MKSVKVVIPLYRECLPELEARLLRHNLRILSRHEVVFVLPDGMDIDMMRGQFNIDHYQLIRVSQEWLGSRNGVVGYNRMMLSESFYALFSDVDYILICQTDSYVFRDELLRWVDLGYDYIGAPWSKKPKYDRFMMNVYLDVRLLFLHRKSGFMKQDLFGRVGNGGFSLRNVQRFREACQTYGDQIEQMCASHHYLDNEDVFWAMVPEDFNYPNYVDALKFSIDMHPDLGLAALNGGLPFGCHGFTRRVIYQFWRDRISI